MNLLPNSFLKAGIITQLSKKDSNANKYYGTSMLNKYKDSNEYLKLIDYRNRIKFKTERKIGFSSRIRFEETQKINVQSRFGKAKMSLNIELHDIKIEILFYKLLLGNCKLKTEFHFCKDRLFYYKSTFPYIDSQERTAIQDAIRAKYLIQREEPLDNFYVYDEDNTVMTLNNDVEFSINYLNTNAEVFELVENSFRLEKRFAKKFNENSALLRYL